jgi:WD40 repeat protein
VAFSPDGAALACGYTGRNALLHNLREPAARPVMLQTERFTVSNLTFLDGGRRLLTSNPYSTIQFWDPVTGDECATFDANVWPRSSLVVSADNRTLAVVTLDRKTKVWRVRP